MIEDCVSTNFSLMSRWYASGPSARSLTYPVNFTLIASMNPCPCGYHDDLEKECTCSISML
jgi:hypothetical protein